jgi:ABC-type spermidine/putrescine transport system permease subunit II
MVLPLLPIVGLAVLSFSARPLSGIPWPLTTEWYTSLTVGNNANWLGRPVPASDPLSSSRSRHRRGLLIGRMLPVMRRRGSLLVTYLSVLVLPGILVGIAVLIFYRGLLGVRTGFWSVVLVHFVWALPFALLCILIVSVRFDRRLLEAAATSAPTASASSSMSSCRS